ncbi:SGNH/GDSL hydrolase family protein [soil metagenome]
MKLRLLVLFGTTLVLACSGTTTTDTPVSDGGADAPVSPDGALLPAFKTYVILGDSISDKGGSGPFFYDLLQKNDDAKYPEYKGKDLATRFGTTVQKASKGGAVSANLSGQVDSLPATLPGPVVATITIGGNDMQAAIGHILQGTDQPDREAFRTNIAKALGKLTAPGRFGAGVEVWVYEANVYDPTDGTGTFPSCPPPLGIVTAKNADTIWAAWNQVVAEEVAKIPHGFVPDMHGTFRGHGVVKTGTDRWFAPDCIHPNTDGHSALRGLFWGSVTGG